MLHISPAYYIGELEENRRGKPEIKAKRRSKGGMVRGKRRNIICMSFVHRT